MSLSELFAEAQRRPIRRCNPHSSEDNHHIDHGRAPWPPRRSEAERRRAECDLLYDLEVDYRKVGWGDPAYVHDEEFGLFRFHDGSFAFSREHAHWALLRKRGRLKSWE